MKVQVVENSKVGISPQKNEITKFSPIVSYKGNSADGCDAFVQNKRRAVSVCVAVAVLSMIVGVGWLLINCRKKH